MAAIVKMEKEGFGITETLISVEDYGANWVFIGIREQRLRGVLGFSPYFI